MSRITRSTFVNGRDSYILNQALHAIAQIQSLSEGKQGFSTQLKADELRSAS